MESLRGSRHSTNHSLGLTRSAMSSKGSSGPFKSSLKGSNKLFSKGSNGRSGTFKSRRNRDCDPESNFISLPGIKYAASFQKGVIEVEWSPAAVIAMGNSSNVFDARSCDKIRYHVFVNQAPYNYTNLSLEDLLTRSHIHQSSTKETSTTIDESLEDGATYDILVVAEAGKIDGPVSGYRGATSVRVSRNNPKIRSDVKRIADLDGLVDSLRVEWRGKETLTFTALSRYGEKVLGDDFAPDDWVTGYDDNADPFLVKLISLVEVSDISATWEVQDGSLPDIFETLSMDASFDSAFFDDFADDVPEVRSRQLSWFDLDIDFEKDFVRRRAFSIKKKLGFADLSLGVTLEIQVAISLDLEGGFFGIDKFDFSMDEKIDVKASAEFAFKTGEELSNKKKVLKLFPPIPLTFVVLGVPIHMKIYNHLRHEFKGKATGKLNLKVQNSFSSQVKTTFDLDNGWNSVSSPGKPKWDHSLNTAVKVGLDASWKFEWKVAIVIYKTFWVAPFVYAGPYLSVEAKNNPITIQRQLPGFHFSKLDIGAQVGVGVEVRSTRTCLLDQKILRESVDLILYFAHRPESSE